MGNDSGGAGWLPVCTADHRQVASEVPGHTSLRSAWKKVLNPPNSYFYFFYFHSGKQMEIECTKGGSRKKRA